MGLRDFLNADHYLTTDTIAQYDRCLWDLHGMGNVTPSIVVVSLDGFVDWVTRTVEEWATPARTFLRERHNCELPRPSLRDASAGVRRPPSSPIGRPIATTPGASAS